MANLLNLLPWRRRRLERELDAELRFHLERRIEELQRSGASIADARRQAALEFGGLAQVREEVRETWVWRWVDNVGRDSRYAFRTLRRGPGFAITALLSLALGTGVNAAIFSLVDQVLLRPLPVNDSDRLVHLIWRGRLGLGNRPDAVTNIEIVGVVKDIGFRDLRDTEREKVYFHFWDRDSDGGTFYLKLRGSGDSAFAAIRAAVAQVDPALPVTLTTFDEQIERSLQTERMLAALSTGFALMALLLSAVGLYGIMSFVVTQRTQEIGVRLALGATRPAALWLVIRDALIMVGAGAAIALPSAWALRRLVEGELFGVRAFDGPTVALAMAVLALVALGGVTLPAWRAASLNPIDALRLE